MSRGSLGTVLWLIAGAAVLGCAASAPAPSDTGKAVDKTVDKTASGDPHDASKIRLFKCADCHPGYFAPANMKAEETKKDEFYCGKCSLSAKGKTPDKPPAPTTPGNPAEFKKPT